MTRNDKIVLHAGAHVASQAIATAITKEADDDSKTAGFVVALLVGLVLNLIIASM